MADIIRACPECGREVWNSCYHDGTDFSSKDMAIAEALRIAVFFGNDDAIKDYQARLNKKNGAIREQRQ